MIVLGIVFITIKMLLVTQLLQHQQTRYTQWKPQPTPPDLGMSRIENSSHTSFDM